MKKIFNLFNDWRNNQFIKNYEFILKFKYLLRNVIGYSRGFKTSLTGKIRYAGPYRPLILGAWTELLIRPGSSLILKGMDKEDNSSDIFYNNPLFPAASTIGLRPHYDALDPPALNKTRIELLGNANFVLGKNTIILSGCYITGNNGAEISIDENSYISQEVIINARYSIKIGKNVMLGHQTRIIDFDAHTIMPENASNQESTSSSQKNPSVFIGDNVWTGFRVTILKGVTIGKGSIIGANSCVASDIPENSIAVGNPAKVIRSNVTWQR